MAPKKCSMYGCTFQTQDLSEKNMFELLSWHCQIQHDSKVTTSAKPQQNQEKSELVNKPNISSTKTTHCHWRNRCGFSIEYICSEKRNAMSQLKAHVLRHTNFVESINLINDRWILINDQEAEEILSKCPTLEPPISLIPRD